MTKLKLSPDLALPIEAVTEAIGFLGRRGSGKTYAAQKLVEEFHRAHAQFVVLDPVGNWWALRLAADGVSPGIPVPVFGGLHGDVPLEPGAGKMIADLIVDRGISAVIDVSQFESDADKARFATDFGARFYYRKKAAPSAVHLVLEECQEFIPQNPQKEETRMLHAYTRMAKLGRNFGIGVSLLSQRPQEVNKKVLNLVELLFCFQLTGPQERKTVDGWISEKGIDEDISGELPKLLRGHAHAWSPAWLTISKVVAIGEKWTLDASSTPTVGTGRVERELSPIDLEKIKTDMAATIEKAKADDPKELRRRIVELERANAKLLANPDSQFSASRVHDLMDDEYKRGYGDASERTRSALKATGLLMFQQAELMEKQSTRVLQVAATLMSELSTGDSRAEVQVGNREQHNGRHSSPSVDRRPVSTSTRRVPVASVPSDGLNRSEQKLLDALALMEQIGVPLTKTNLGFFTGYTEGGRFNNLIGGLRTKGYIEPPRNDGTVEPTDEGRAAGKADDAPINSIEDLHTLWLSKLSASEGKVLAVLLDEWPAKMKKDRLGQMTDYSEGGRFNNILGRLRSLGAIDYPTPGYVVATDTLFPEGLREAH